MGDGGKRRRRGAADGLSGRIGLDQIGVRLLEIPQLADEEVVVGIGDLGFVVLVVPLVVMADLRAKAWMRSSTSGAIGSAGSVTGAILPATPDQAGPAARAGVVTTPTGVRACANGWPASSEPGSAGRRAERIALWSLLLLWLAAPFTIGATLAEALDSVDATARTVASLVAWAGWAGAQAAILLPRTLTLTVVRTVIPAGVPAAAWAAWDASFDVTAGAGLGVAVAATVVALCAATADTFVDGSSYGAERRLSLRARPALLLGPVPLAWALVVAGVVVGPVLLAAGAVGARRPSPPWCSVAARPSPPGPCTGCRDDGSCSSRRIGRSTTFCRSGNPSCSPGTASPGSVRPARRAQRPRST